MSSLTAPIYHASRINRPRSARRRRRTKREIENLKAGIYDIVEADRPMTVRQVFYRAVAAGLIEKTEREYQNTIVRLILQMRRDGELPWFWIADNTRLDEKATAYRSLSDSTARISRFYRRDLWADQEVYVEIWLEKDALSGVLYEETAKWGVPLMVSRGYSSETFLHAAAETIEAKDKAAFIYQFGNHDPSGVNIAAHIERKLREYAPSAEVHFQRVAVLPQQIESMRLPTRPTKQTDTRAKTLKGESVDVDAIPPRELRRLCRECMERHIDKHALEMTKMIEAEERASLQDFANKLARDDE